MAQVPGSLRSEYLDPRLQDILEPVDSAPPPATPNDENIFQRDPRLDSVLEGNQGSESNGASLEDAAIATGQGVLGGLAKSAPVVAGAYTGAQAGAALGALAGPLGVPVGAALGLGAGIYAGMNAGEAINAGLSVVNYPGSDTPLTFKDRASVPVELRSYVVGGETFGATLPYIAVPYMLSRDGVVFAENFAGRIINRMVDTAEKYPISFLASELSMALGSGAGAGVAEEMAPGNNLVRFAGEVIGGLSNPAGYTIAAARLGVNRLTALWRTLQPAAKEQEATKFLLDTIERFGENPDDIITAIRRGDPFFSDIPLLAGQKSGSVALQAIEAKIAQTNAEFGFESQKAVETSQNVLRGMVEAFAKSGDPQALRLAAEMQSARVEAAIESRIHLAEQEALKAAGAIDPSNAESLTKFGLQVHDALDQALKDARAVEKELWAQVDRSLPVDYKNVTAQVDKLRREYLLRSESLPPAIENELRIATGEEVVPSGLVDQFGREIPSILKNADNTVGEMLKLRTRMLDLSREAAARGEWSDARVYGNIAEGALDDLSAVASNAEALAVARAASRSLNDKFTRSFAGKILSTTKTGDERIPPELAMKRAFGEGGEVASLQFRELREAGTFGDLTAQELRDAVEAAGREHFSRVVDIQDRTIRTLAADIINTTTKHVDPDKLANFRAKNAELLAQFPALDKNLQDAGSAERFLESTRSQMSQAQKFIKEQAAFARVLKAEDPAVAVAEAITGANPTTDLARLSSLAIRGGTEAREGLKSSVFAWAAAKARDKNGEFSIAAYKELFNGPVTPNGPTLKDLLVSSRVFDKQAVENLDQVLDQMARVEDLANTRQVLNDMVLGKTSPAVDLAVRLWGARVTSMLPTGQAHALIVQGAGSRFMRQVFERIPKEKAEQTLVNLLKNPEALATLLEKGVTQQDKFRLAMQMRVYLMQAGVGLWDNDNDPSPQ
jgi:hypothetical protein